MPIEHQELIVREHERFACRLPATLYIESPGVVLSGAAADTPDAVAADLVDCSAGGAGLQTPVFLPRGCRLRLQILSAPGAPGLGAEAPQLFEAPVRIQRVTMVSRTPVYYLGTAFTDLDAPRRAAVDRLLDQLRAQAATATRGADAEGASGA